MANPRARHVRDRRARVRYDRLTALLGASGVTVVSVLGGVGLLPIANATPGDDGVAARTSSAPGTVGREAAGAAGATSATGRVVAADAPTTVPRHRRFDRSDVESRRGPEAVLAVPADSGEGRRVVFDQTTQRVWLVGEDGEVERSYPVSGSIEDNLDPGRYEVYSRSEQAWGIDNGGTMRFMVRFAHGERAAIGFHDIPYKDGELVQTRAQLGTPLSSGCVRQARADAKALWRFAPVGTPVVVVAT